MNRFFLWLLLSSMMPLCQLFAQTIPVARIVDWTQAGVRPDTVQGFPVVSATSIGFIGDGATLNDAAWAGFLANYSGQGVVLTIPAGRYRFAQTINLQDNIILKGSGADSTVLEMDLGGSGHALQVQGSRGADSSHLSVSAAKGDRFVRLASPARVQVGDWVQLQQYDLDWVTSSWAEYRTGQIVQVDRISGDTAWLHQALRMDYDTARTAALWTLRLRKNVGIECLKILRLDDTAPQQGSNILFKYVTNCWVSGIESENCTFAHVETEFSAHVTVAHSYFHHGFSYGGGGRAYGVVFQMAASDCRAENNIFEHLRHSVLLQAGCNGNVIAYNYSHDPYWDNTPNDGTAEWTLHGNYVYANLFEQNICQNIAADNSHGPNGPDNVFFRNRAELYGIFNDANSPNQIYVANEVTNNTFPYRLVNYRIQGTGHFVYGNSDKGTTTPSGTQNVPEISYAYAQRPSFVPPSQWGNLGTPNPYNMGSIPAYDRWQSGHLFQGVCGNVLPVVVEPLKAPEILHVYPNPATTALYLESTEVVERAVLYQLNGQAVHSWALQGQSLELALPALPQGVYILRVWTNEGAYIQRVRIQQP